MIALLLSFHVAATEMRTQDNVDYHLAINNQYPQLTQCLEQVRALARMYGTGHFAYESTTAIAVANLSSAAATIAERLPCVNAVERPREDSEAFLRTKIPREYQIKFAANLNPEREAVVVEQILQFHPNATWIKRFHWVFALLTESDAAVIRALPEVKSLEVKEAVFEAKPQNGPDNCATAVEPGGK